jgi:hypothetical protein
MYLHYFCLAVSYRYYKSKKNVKTIIKNYKTDEQVDLTMFELIEEINKKSGEGEDGLSEGHDTLADIIDTMQKYTDYRVVTTTI